MGKLNYSRARWTRPDRFRFGPVLDAMNTLTGKKYGVVSEGFFAKQAVRVTAERADLVLLAAVGHRPPEYAMVGLLEGRPILPTERSDDLKLLAATAGVKLEEVFCLYTFLKWDYGVVWKSEDPIHLRDSEIASSVGVGAEFDEAQDSDPSAEVWWQRWGGALYSFSLESERIRSIQHGSLLGDFEMVPLHLVS